MKGYFNQVASDYDKEFLVQWKRIVQDNTTIFKRPQLINYEYFTEEDKLNGRKVSDINLTTLEGINLYVYPTMLPPGKNYYAIKVPDENRLFRLDSVGSVAERDS